MQGTAPAPLPPTLTGTIVEALRSNQEFRTGSIQILISGNEGIIETRNRAYSSPSSIRIHYDAARATYSVSNIIGTAYDFGPDAYFNYSDEFTSLARTAIDAVRSIAVSRSGSNSKITLTYTSYGFWRLDTLYRLDSLTPIDDSNYFYFGIPTASANMPTAGSAQYRGIALGILNESAGVLDLTGSVVLDANFATGSIGTTLALTGTLRAAPRPTAVSLPTLQGVASIGAGTNGFRGTLTTADNSYEGSILGAFFGPAAQEFGYSFGINDLDKTKLGGGVAVGKQ